MMMMLKIGEEESAAITNDYEAHKEAVSRCEKGHYLSNTVPDAKGGIIAVTWLPDAKRETIAKTRFPMTKEHYYSYAVS